MVTIRQGNVKKDRVIPIGERALKWVLHYQHQVRLQLLVNPEVTALDGVAGLTPNGVTLVTKEYIVVSGLSHWGSCHQFRHAIATQMLENGADIRWIQAMLDHRSVESKHKSASGSPFCGAAGGWVSQGYVGKVMIRYILCHYSSRSEERIMPKEAVFTMKLENSLREDFIEAAKASHRPASQVICELMREYIQSQNDS